MESRNYYNISFSYVDEYNDSTNVEFKHPTDDGLYEDNIVGLLNDFKKFLTSAGYSHALVKRIQYLKDSDIKKIGIDKEDIDWWD